MSVVGERITVDDTAGGTEIHSGNAGVSGTRLVVTNSHATLSVALGPSGVTLAAGYELKATLSISLELPAGDALFAIASTTDVILHVLKTGA